MNIIITTDSAADIPESLLKEYSIKTIPLYVILGDKEYKDGQDLSCNDIFDFVKQSKKLPKTAAVSINDFENFFENLLGTADNTYIIHHSISSKISSCYSNAITASKKFPGKVFVIDSKSLSSGIGLLAIFSAKLAKEGKWPEEIYKNTLSRVNNVQASFIIQDIEYLYKGGRCSAIGKIGANILKIKPQIYVQNGEMLNVAKPRGKIEIVLKQYIDSTLAKFNNPDKSYVFVTHSDMDKTIENQIIDYIKSKNIFENVINSNASATISSHCGKGTLGILYINDGDKL